GDMTKREYLKANYDAVIYNDIGPFTILDRVDKCLFNYQYYNALAKQHKSESTENNMEFQLKKEFIAQSNYFYRKKDAATKQALKLLDYKNIEAYYIKVRSHSLKGKLFEIICTDYGLYNMILHSTDTVLLNNLKEEGVFSEGSRISLIDSYVNQRY
ncbi:MAG: DUF6648 family protein, partial [Anaerotignaceae bacterium]